jgi:hypothetical protein
MEKVAKNEKVALHKTRKKMKKVDPNAVFLKPGVATHLCVAKIIKCVAKSSKQSFC